MNKLTKVRVNYKNPLAYYEIACFLKYYINKDSVIVCIGTDRYVVDSLGPLVGTMLKDKNLPLPIYGTVNNPIHALNIDKKLLEIKSRHSKSNIVAVDACLGSEKTIGEIEARNYSIHPGKGVGRSLPSVGNCSIIGITNLSNSDDILSLNSVKLSFVMDMAKIITKSIIHAYYL
ncbi:spore protease YyaC [Clostridium sp. DJ247]|uniref:spore protease YyaC n=1 Tax=Clostridium sp. DJ247 TaxID=2726188 RepID=UPI001627BF80|nr:spore protease YyaC [Clostridium sp. DJ247]MBC2580234.1 spore protease YyaC [Clostridium sp. DJ247]